MTPILWFSPDGRKQFAIFAKKYPKFAILALFWQVFPPLILVRPLFYHNLGKAHPLILFHPTLRELIFADFAVFGQKREIKFPFFTPEMNEPRKLISEKFLKIV